MRVFIEAHGCASNQADFEIIAGLLKRGGFELVEDAERSDLVILLTCSVKTMTVNRMSHRIKELLELKMPLIIAGCMPKTYPELIERIAPRASLLCPESVAQVVRASRLALKGERAVFLEDTNQPKLGFPRCRRNPTIGIVQIARGCRQSCAYCNEPYKGRLLSYPPELIESEVRAALRDGCKEIWLTSLDNSCYGLELGTSLARLLRRICKLRGRFMLRVGMANPLYLLRMLNELIDAYEDEKIFKFLHLPLQSGSDKVLRAMRRGYTLGEFESIVKGFRRAFPSMSFVSDIIVGFPGERDSDFGKSLRAIKRLEFDVVNVTKFGAHPSTPAAELNALPSELVKERSRELSRLTSKVSLRVNQRWIGWEGSCLIDERGKAGTWVGRNFAYKPIVVESKEELLGRFVEVEIVDCTATHLVGRIM